MVKQTKALRYVFLGVAAAAVLTSGACGAKTAAPRASGDTGASSASVSATARTATTPAPSATPTPAPVALELVKKGFGANAYSSVGWAFLVKNPNTLAATGVRYQVAAYDDAGTVVDTQSSSLPVLLGGATIGVAGAMYSPNKTVKVARLDVQLKPEKFEKVDIVSELFTVQNATFSDDRFLPQATGVVRTASGKDLRMVEVFTLIYDAEGSIIGGGFTFIDFIPAGGQAAAKMSITFDGKPERVELYPMLGNLTILDLNKQP